MAAIEDLLQGVPVGLLEQQCSDQHLLEISAWVPHWRNVSAHLGLSDVDEEQISHYPGGLARQNYDMLRTWKTRFFGMATYRTLANAFNSIGRQDLVDSLCNIVRKAPVLNQPTTDVPLGVVKYAEYLKDVYKCKPCGVQWPPVVSKCYVNLLAIQNIEDFPKEIEVTCTLAMIHSNLEVVKKLKRTIKIDQVGLLEDGKRARCIIVEGIPGIGKSTFCWHLGGCWAQNKILHDYHLVVLLRSRDKKVQKATEVSDLFCYKEQPKQEHEAVMEWIRSNKGDGVMMVLDGYDELSQDLQTSSIFADIIGGEVLPKMTVLVSSRPSANQNLKQLCQDQKCQYIEVIGFDKEEIQKYVDGALEHNKELRDELNSYLELHPHIHGLMYCPLNCAIIVQIFRDEMKKGSQPPQTLTEVYQVLIKTVLKRHEHKLSIAEKPKRTHPTPNPGTFTFRNVVRAIRPVGEWKSLSAELEISAAKIKEIDVNNRGQVAECKHDMVQFWLESDTSCSWSKLIDALISNDQSRFAEEIKDVYCPSSQDNDATINDLKGAYSNLRPEVDFPPVPTFSFINLALIRDTTETKKCAFFFETIQGSVDDVIETKVTITYEGLLNCVNVKNRIILLEGRPGCGKTTLTRKISKDWGEGAILSFVKYLFLIPLRHFFATPIDGLNTILEYFDINDLETKIKGNAGEGVCFIFDGLDEYSQKYAKKGRSWFEKLLRGDILTSSIIMVTSRPNASVELRESVHTRGEVLGFLKEQIDQYIDKSYPTNASKASEVKAYLHNHQNIQHMCYIPLHLVMILFVYDLCQEQKVPLPKTETDVYNLFTVMSLVRYYSKIGEDIVLSDLQSLPLRESAIFLSISKLAYNTTTASKTFISLRDIKGDFSVSDIANLGIIVVDKKVGFSGGEPILSFVHLTNQEFLAAYYISTLPPDEQLQAIREHIGQSHMGVVLKFFCGITKLQNPDHWTEIMDNALVDEHGEKMVILSALHCVFESQNGQRCRELFSKAGGKLLIKNETLSLLDYCVIGYCLESAREAVKNIGLQCQLTAEGLCIIGQMLTRSLETVKEFDIYDDLCDKDKLLALKGLLNRFPNVESLNLRGCFKEEQWDRTLLGDVLKETQLQTLNLSGNNLGHNGMKALCAASSLLSNLKELNLIGCFKDDQWDRTLLGDLLKGTPYLQTLRLAGNELGHNGMKAVCAGRSSLSNIKELNLSQCNIGDEGMKALGATAEHLSSLREIYLMNNNLGDDSQESLMLIINQCPLEMLWLWNVHGGEWVNNFSAAGEQRMWDVAKRIRPGMGLQF